MKRFYIILVAAAFIAATSLPSFGFGRVGHATIAKIAENHLNPAAKATIEKYLDGESIVTYATWMDQVRKTDAYKHTDGWHTAAVDEKGQVINSKAVKGLNGEIRKLEGGKYKTLSDSAVAVGIKLIVHMAGDMHCPSHTKFKDLSQNVTFKFNGQEFPFHKFFDKGIIELSRPGWEYEDYAGYLDTLDSKSINKLQRGEVKQWAAENSKKMRPLYATLADKAEFNGDQAAELVKQLGALEEKQMQIAGYRLAGILNRLFSK